MLQNWINAIDPQIILVSLTIVAGAYLIGSINTSIIVGKLKSDIDIRDHGSGNAGATNALRTMGKVAGLLVLLGDALKAAVAMLAVIFLLPLFGFENVREYNPQFLYMAGVGTVLGHNFPIFFKFKGGKGIVVSTVAMIFAAPLVGVSSLAVGVAVILITRYVSLGSMLGAISSIVLAAIFIPTEIISADYRLLAFLLILTILCLRMHSGNIARLLRKEENKIGAKKS